MKKFVISLALAKFALLVMFAALTFPGGQTAHLQTRPPTALPTATPNSNETINRPVSEPYKGDLSIFEGQDRAKNLQIERVMDILKITEGKAVADIGAGSGWFTTLAAKRVGNKGKVFAVDINQEAVNYINERAKRENFPNIQTVLGALDNPNLPKNSTDAVLILKTYHEFSEPIKVLKNLRPALKANALVGIIDKNGAGDDHGVNRETVVAELKRAGFALVEEHDFVKPDRMDYFLVFRMEKMVN